MWTMSTPAHHVSGRTFCFAYLSHSHVLNHQKKPYPNPPDPMWKKQLLPLLNHFHNHVWLLLWWSFYEMACLFYGRCKGTESFEKFQRMIFLLNFRDHQDVYFFLVSSFLPGSLPQMPFFSWALSYCWNRKFDLNWVSYFVPHLFFAMPLLSTSTVLYWYLSIFSMVVMTSCYKWACQHCWVKTATMLSIHIAVLFLFCLFLENTAWKISERIVAFYCFVNNISSYYCSRDSLPQ